MQVGKGWRDVKHAGDEVRLPTCALIRTPHLLRHTVNKVLPLKDTPHFLEYRNNVAFWEPYLP